MHNFAIPTEPVLRITVFVVVVLLVTAWEIGWPNRVPGPRSGEQPLRRRINNLLLMLVNSGMARLLIPLTAAGVATQVESYGFGLLHRLPLPGCLEVVVAVIILDLVIWWQHRLFHAVPWLWRLHRVHHADLHLDWTTGVRFHPLEHLVSLGIKLIAVALLGASALAVILFEVLLNASSLFNHANGRLPAPFDRILRWFIVTPSLHRIHHSVEPSEQQCNFGFNLTVWDRVAGRLRTPETRGNTHLIQGVADLQDVHSTEQLSGLLVLPFRRTSRHAA